jgi:murein L,D-transpeptidase YcbB/YkuD
MRVFLAAIAFAAVCSLTPASAHTWRASQIEDLKKAAQAAPLEGVPAPEDGLAQVEMFEHLADLNPDYAAASELAATALFLRLAETYAIGATDPAVVDPNWRLPRPSDADAAALMGAIDAGASPSGLLNELLPSSADYRALRSELARLRDASPSPGNDANLTQVLANLERQRWLPRTLPGRRIEVLLAEYELRYFDGVSAAPARFDVIVGAPRSPSPVFEATIESITLNPDWTPPASIVTRELAPRFARNPSAAAREGFEVLDAAGQAIDANAVDWRARPFPYHLRQLPGPQNALGRLRFDLPNPFQVYLHDTPGQAQFERTTRALSHGCIRVKAPTALAAALLGGDWGEAILQDAIAAGATQVIPLSAPTPVYVLYLTAVANDDGSLRYLEDINHRDAAIAGALGAPSRQVVAEIGSHYTGCGL